MGRWQSRLATAEKNANTLQDRTDKTDKTPSKPVLSVLSVPDLGECTNFSADEPSPSDDEVAAAEWEERAAILEHDVGLPRAEAERLATEQFVGADNFATPQTSERSEVLQQNAPKPGSDASPALRPASWLPEPSPGIRILRPAVEVEAAEYDTHLDAIIAALPAGSDERARLAFAKRKGWCFERDGEGIFTRGRT